MPRRCSRRNEGRLVFFNVAVGVVVAVGATTISSMSLSSVACVQEVVVHRAAVAVGGAVAVAGLVYTADGLFDDKSFGDFMYSPLILTFLDTAELDLRLSRRDWTRERIALPVEALVPGIA